MVTTGERRSLDIFIIFCKLVMARFVRSFSSYLERLCSLIKISKSEISPYFFVENDSGRIVESKLLLWIISGYISSHGTVPPMDNGILIPSWAATPEKPLELDPSSEMGNTFAMDVYTGFAIQNT